MTKEQKQVETIRKMNICIQGKGIYTYNKKLKTFIFGTFLIIELLCTIVNVFKGGQSLMVVRKRNPSNISSEQRACMIKIEAK